MKSLYLREWETFIRYHELPGEGTPLLYLPGIGFPSLAQFVRVIIDGDLASRHSLLVDYIGSGLSDASPNFDYAIESHARSIAAVLDHEGVKECVVIGHSMGGTVGIALAILRPDLVCKLVVAEGNLTPGGGGATRRITSFSQDEYVASAHGAYLEKMREAEREGNELASFINTAWSSADALGLYRSSAAIVALDESFKDRFRQLPIPRTFVYGQTSIAENPADALPDAPDPQELEPFGIQIAIVPDAGHFMMFDNLGGFVEVLQTALGGS